LNPPSVPWWPTSETLHHRPFAADPAGTRPSTPGCGREPGPHGTSGVAADGGSARWTTGAGAGESPPPCPSANRSLSGPNCPWAAPATVASAATAATTARTRTTCVALSHLLQTDLLRLSASGL